MSQVEQSIEVQVPVSTAYNQWTQFEEFPRFMRHVEEIRQIDDTHLHWKVTIAGRTAEFDAEVTEQIPDARVAWRSTSGPRHAGAVDFHRLSDSSTQMMVVMDVEPEGAAQKAADRVGDAFSVFENQIREDLQTFKRMIEDRGEESGAWRGEVRPEGSGR